MKSQAPVPGAREHAVEDQRSRFTDNGALKILHHDLYDCVNPARLPGSGTYAVKDFSATFNYSDGRRVRLAFAGIGYTKANPTPATLSMSYEQNQMTKR
jgi:hypothetical protein